jgi:SET domain-containing protein
VHRIHLLGDRLGEPLSEPTEARVDTFRQSDAVEVRRDTAKGRGARGVYARRAIAADELIERVPVILIPKSQVFGDNAVSRNAARISWYVFSWNVPTKREYVAVALGYGSIYNHSFTPNAVYRCVAPDGIEYRSLRPIAAGEEILINYNGRPDDLTPMYFPMP